ncbi:MAG: hypothetical protein JWO62_1675 [Acidimicrobiaceae bacterium]|nr:hypothetical protein [Acidimicrobiaceae bacterium]
MTRPLTLLESADLLGRYRYVELAAFVALGKRAAHCSEPTAAAYLAGASLAHGWRAHLVEERLPVSVGLPTAADCTRSPSPELDSALVALTGGEDVEVLDGLLGALYPAMAAGYVERIAAASAAADPPIVRLLGRLLADLDAVRREGAGVAALLAVPTGATRHAVEELLGRGAGPFGTLREPGQRTGARAST